MIIINPREVAAQAMVEIMAEDAYNQVVLKRLLRQNGAMSAQDRGFVTEIVNGTLRNLYYIDFMINGVSKLNTEKMKPWILAVLRIAVYQLKFMDRVPASAAVNEAVKLTNARGYEKLSGFVNGVLRSVSAGKGPELPDQQQNPAEYLSILYSHPIWLVKMWIHQYGYEFVKKLCIADNCSPKVSICCNSLKTTAKALKSLLEEKGISVEDGYFLENILYLSKTEDLARLEAFQEGLFHVQDESSALAVAVLDPKPGERVLDMCAAPGGKSFSIAEKMENKGEVISRDIYEHKLEFITEGAKRLAISIIHPELQNAELPPKEGEQYDRVLLDAPCSGLGLLRKKPDIRFRKDGNQIDSLIQIQRNLLKSAAAFVKPGGVLVYSTCTICRKENLKNIEWFLEGFDFEPDTISEFLPDTLQEGIIEENMLQLFPNVHGTDGFFIARMRKRSV